MKEIIKAIEDIATASKGQEVTFMFKNVEGETLKQLAKHYGVKMIEPDGAQPYFRIWVDFEGLFIIIRGKELKQVVTFK